VGNFAGVVSLAVEACPAPAAAAGRCGAHPWCDTSLSPAQRAHLMLAAMSQGDKLSALVGAAAGDVDLPSITWTDGPVGVTVNGPATALPSGTALAAGFDPSMANAYGSVIGLEAKQRGLDGVYGPNVNLMRTPLGGRTFEAYGEDPFLASEMVVPYIDGMQGEGVMADVKHFAANNQEGQNPAGVDTLTGVNGGRATVDVLADERTLRETELPAFHAAFTRAHSATTMCSVNLVNDLPVCAHPGLLRDLLRRQWGWDGYVLPDATACKETAADLNAGLNGGSNLANDCYRSPHVELALQSGQVTQATVDQRVLELLRELFDFGFFDRKAYVNAPAPDQVAAGKRVAGQVATNGAVLLRNRADVLPVDRSRVRSIAVIGGAASTHVSGWGSSQVSPNATTTPLDGITKRAAQDHISVSSYTGTDPTSAAAAARQADVAIVVAGDMEGEGEDKNCLSLNVLCFVNPAFNNPELTWGDEDAIIKAVAGANLRTVVVLETGAPVLTPWRSSIAALLEAWYPGEDGGTAIAQLLFGDANPSGKLPATFPQQEGDIPTAAGGPEQYPGVIDPTDGTCFVQTTFVPCPFSRERYSEGVLVGYRWYDANGIEPAYPFGFGLSYTTFRYGGLHISPAGDGVSVSFDVTNSGKRAGADVAQVYVGDPSSTGEPPRQLKGFRKVPLQPGQTKRVQVSLPEVSFAHWKSRADTWAVSAGDYTLYVGNSSDPDDLPLRATRRRQAATLSPNAN